MEEKRKHERFIAENFFVSAVHGEDTYICEALDISISGMKLIFPPDYMGDIFEVSFSFEDNFISVPVVIKWKNEEKPNLVGVKFIKGLRASETFTLLEFLKKEK